MNILYAQDIPAESVLTEYAAQQKKVFFFNFQDKSLIDKYGYLTYIIPNSVIADLRNLAGYEIEILPAIINYLERNASQEERTNYVNTINQHAEGLKADYLVTGAFLVEGNTVRVQSQVFDTERKEIIYVGETKNRISAVLLEMIEEITDNISEELERAEELRDKERRRKEDERKAGISPFLGLYSFLSGITFGAGYGRVNLLDEWGDVFDNTDEVSLILSYELANINAVITIPFINNLAITGKFDYFSASTEEYSDYRHQYLDFTGYILNFAYLIRASQFFNLALHAGGGVADVEIFMEADRDQDGNIITQSETIKERNNPYYTVCISMNFFLSSLKIESGFSYNKVQYSPKEIDFIAFYFSLGYRI